MNIFRKAAVLLVTVSLSASQTQAQNIHVMMMESTCKIVGTGSVGSGFIVVKPFTDGRPGGLKTLVTAAHVLDAAKADNVTLVLRKAGSSNSFSRVEVPIRIRRSNIALWTKHPEVDVAAMHVSLPQGIPRYLVSSSMLLTDSDLERFEISPGAELLCLGYPLGLEANPEGFPVLRSGRIASYPLVPTKARKGFLFDFTVFRGNSGGPVYMEANSPRYGGSTHLDITIQGLVGLVTEERSLQQRTEGLYESRETTTPLGLGYVVHASFIRELVDMLPAPSVPSTQPPLSPRE